jgi:hypothetical protein
MVVDACNPSNSGSGHQEGCGLRPAWKKDKRDLILTNKLGMVAHIYNPTYKGCIRRIMVQG